MAEHSAQQMSGAVGFQFVRQYYTVLNRDPTRLHCFYKKNSLFTHADEGVEVEPARGQISINSEIERSNFQNCKVVVSQLDTQPSLNDGVIVMVLGEMSNNGEHSRRFAQTFFLVSEEPGRYYVLNDLFRFLKDSPSQAETQPLPIASQTIANETSEPQVESQQQSEAAPEVQAEPSQPIAAVVPAVETPAVNPTPTPAVSETPKQEQANPSPSASSAAVNVPATSSSPIPTANSTPASEKPHHDKSHHEKPHHDKSHEKPHHDKSHEKSHESKPHQPRSQKGSSQQQQQPQEKQEKHQEKHQEKQQEKQQSQQTQQPPQPQTWATRAATQSQQWGTQISQVKGITVELAQDPPRSSERHEKSDRHDNRHERYDRSDRRQQEPDNDYSVFVREVSNELDGELKEIFSRFGTVLNITYLKTNNAFVDFQSPEQADAAIKADAVRTKSGTLVKAEKRNKPRQTGERTGSGAGQQQRRPLQNGPRQQGGERPSGGREGGYQANGNKRRYEENGIPPKNRDASNASTANATSNTATTGSSAAPAPSNTTTTSASKEVNATPAPATSAATTTSTSASSNQNPSNRKAQANPQNRTKQNTSN